MEENQDQSVPKPTQVEMEGLEVAPGTFKTSTGTIRIPLSKLKKKAQQEQSKAPKQPQQSHVFQEQKAQLPEIRTSQHERVSFKTDIGSMPSVYNPVIELPDWVILGVLPESFIPASYKENKNLVLEISSPSIETCKVVFTGCKFTDTTTRTTYMVLMKV